MFNENSIKTLPGTLKSWIYFVENGLFPKKHELPKKFWNAVFSGEKNDKFLKDVRWYAFQNG
jgi:hypothetical protein